MSGHISHDPALRTTTLVWAFVKPLATEDTHLLARLMARTIGLGYATVRLETDALIQLTAVLTAPRTQPFTRVRELVPGAVVSALVGEATAQEPAS